MDTDATTPETQAAPEQAPAQTTPPEPPRYRLMAREARRFDFPLSLEERAQIGDRVADLGRELRALERLEPFTKLIGPGSIYGITPLSEQVARAMASTLRERPVHTWDLPKLAAPASPDAEPVDGLGDHHYPGFEGDPDDAFDEEE